MKDWIKPIKSMDFHLLMGIIHSFFKCELPQSEQVFILIS